MPSGFLQGGRRGRIVERGPSLTPTNDNRSVIMASVRSVIICKSVHRQNTAKVARAIADVMHAEVVSPEDFPHASLERYDVVGFGSGIYYGVIHPALWDWVRRLRTDGQGRRSAFVFTTAGLPVLWRVWHGPLKADLTRTGFDIIGEFNCGGFDTWGPLWLTGGINRRHPSPQDLDRAAAFARDVLKKCGLARGGSALPARRAQDV